MDTEQENTMQLDDIPEYQEMRRGLMALRLEVPQTVADDMLALCEKAALAIRDAGFEGGRQAERALDQVCREALS